MDMRGKYKRSEESKKRSSDSRKKYFEKNEDAREKVANITKMQWANSETRETILSAVKKAGRRKDVREKRRKAAIKRWKDPEFRKKVIAAQSGENNANYNPDRSQVIHRHGRGFLKSQVKRLLQERCKWCGSTDNLQLDHIIAICAGGDSKDSNAQTLCVKCNNKKRVTIDMDMMKSYRIRGISDRVMPRTIPSQAGRKSGRV